MKGQENWRRTMASRVREADIECLMTYDIEFQLYKGYDYSCWWTFAPPIYSTLYYNWLLVQLSAMNLYEVDALLEEHFPDFDFVDFRYLNDLLADIDGETNGKYYYRIPEKDDSIEVGKRFRRNLERANEWVTEKAQEFTQEPPVLAPVNEQQPNSQPSVQWEKSVSDLAELFYRLSRSGFIDLATHRSPEGNLSALSRHVCQLFQIPATVSKNAAVALYTCLSKFTPEQLAPGPIDVAVLSKALGRKPDNLKTLLLGASLAGLGPNSDYVPEAE
jgi:hypothetical protein